MPKLCSLELRERVVEAVESGASRREAAEWFDVSPSSAIKWMQRRQETGSIAPKPSGGSLSPLEAHADFLLALIADHPDLTLDEIVAAMRKRRIPGSRSAVWRFFERHNISFKKSLRAAEQERADVARARRRWLREQGMFDPARLVFIDETSTNTVTGVCVLWVFRLDFRLAGSCSLSLGGGRRAARRILVAGAGRRLGRRRFLFWEFGWRRRRPVAAELGGRFRQHPIATARTGAVYDEPKQRTNTVTNTG